MNVTVHAPELVVGLSVPIAIDIDVTTETRIDGVDAEVVCDQGWSLNQRESRRDLTTFVSARLTGPQVLPVGRTTLTLDVTAPMWAPPSHYLSPAYARTDLRVHVLIPWRFNHHDFWPLDVRVPSAGGVPPVLVQLGNQSLRTEGPRIEVALSSWVVAPGDPLSGTCTVFGLTDDEPREVTFGFVPMVSLSSSHIMPGPTIRREVVLPAGRAGRPVPFSIVVPDGITPSFSALTHSVAWLLQACTGSWLGRKAHVQMPILIAHASVAAAGAGATRRPVSIRPDDRVVDAFSSFALAAGWHATLDADRHARAITQHAGEPEADLFLSAVPTGAGPSRLIARVVYPSLGLGLDVAAHGGTPIRLGSADTRDEDVWDREHAVHARSADQARPVLRALVPALRAAAALGAIVRWTDETIVFERVVGAVTEADLAAAATTLARIAAAIATESARVPVPPDCDIDLAAWRRLATELAGHVSRGDLSVRGTRDGAAVHAGLVFDAHGRPVALRAVVGASADETALAGPSTCRLHHPASEADESDLPAVAIAQLAAWPEAIIDLHVAPTFASAAWRLPDSHPHVVDAAQARELVDRLVALRAALDVGAAGAISMTAFDAIE